GRRTSAGGGGKKPPYQALTFTVKGNARLAAVVKMFDEFYHTPLLHQVKRVEIKHPRAVAESKGDTKGEAKPAEPGAAAPGPAAAPVAPAAPGAPGAPRGPGAPGAIRGPGAPGVIRGPAAPAAPAVPGVPGETREEEPESGPLPAPGELIVDLTIEALLVDGAQKRDKLLPGGSVRPLDMLALSSASRRYADIAAKDIFNGPPRRHIAPRRDPDSNPDSHPARCVRLTSIIGDDDAVEAFFYDVFNNVNMRVKAREGRVMRAFSTFKVQDEEGETLILGHVLRIIDRDIIFRVDDRYYSI